MIPFSRRQLLIGAGALLASPPGRVAAAGPDGWLATASTAGGFAAVAVDPGLACDPCAVSPVRLHGIEASGTGPLAVAVGRRPGKIAIVFHRQRKTAVGTFAPGAGRVFSGHGRFSADGRVFFTNEIERPAEAADRPTMGRGVVARRDVAGGFQILDEWPSGGDGPHDLIRAGGALFIANGGIEPNTEEARDAEVTGASIAVIEPASGGMRGEGRLGDDLASLSLRHLAASGAGQVVVAAQDLYNDGIARPLLFEARIDGTLLPFEAPDAAWRELRGYVGSVAFDPSGRFVACASPRGGRVAVWRADRRYVGAVPLVDGCGLAGHLEAGRFIATSGYGETVVLAASDAGVAIIRRTTGGPRFDNHMVRVS